MVYYTFYIVKGQIFKTILDFCFGFFCPAFIFTNDANPDVDLSGSTLFITVIENKSGVYIRLLNCVSISD